MSGDLRNYSRETSTTINSERTVPTNGSASAEERSLSAVMDSHKVADQTKACDQTENAVSSSNPQSRQKKSSFQITKVITKDAGKDTKDDPEAVDDLDETNTEDISSGLLDSSKMTDADQEPSSADTLHSPGGEDLWPLSVGISKVPLAAVEPKEKVIDTHSRFKIVKIESKDRTKKGRWTCMDFTDPEHTEKSDEQGTGSSSAANSIYYIPGVDDQSKSPFAAAIVYNEGHPVLEPNPLKSPLYINDTGFQQLHFFQRPYNIQPISVSDQEMLSRLREQQLSSGTLPTNALPAASQPTGSVPTGTLVSGTLPAGTLPPSTLPSGTLPSGTLQSGSLTTGTLPTGTLTGATGLSAQAVPFSHGGLLHSTMPAANEMLSATQVASTSSKPFGQLYTSEIGANSAGLLVDDQSELADNHSAFPDGDQRGLAKSGGSKDPEQTLAPSKRTSQTSPLLAMVSATMNSSGFPIIDNDESGTSSVAIDNKIEQAMDLVKSHLMFAVREEVEVLKEQIKELLEKNTQLEYENSILRADASPETLAKLQSGQP